ncbi:MAG: 50S ribosomal protein L10 [Candidatus Levybacteria bacterium]|nr:50S ribosomal protein L10 [Candidatus Levybacteria bacterium]
MNKVSTNRQKKEKIIAELNEKVEKAKAMVFTNYQGMTHKQIEGLKKALRKTDAEMTVTKNTLLKLALARSTIQGVQKATSEEKLAKGPTATLFVYSDIVLPLKELARVIKNLKMPSIKFGIFDQKMLTAEDVIKLAALPSREILLAQVVSSMKAPIYGLHRALSWNLMKLVMTLSAIQKTKEASN